jgi:hypothetical protein
VKNTVPVGVWASAAKDVTERIYRGFPGNQLPSDVRGDVGQLPPTV